MDDSSPERALQRALWPRALVAGAVLGALCFAGASLVLFQVEGLRVGTVGVLATIAVALAAGMWAAAPVAASDADPPLRERWMGAGLATALAGAFATLWPLIPLLARGPLGRVLALLVLLGLPVYALGLLLPTLAAAGERWEEELEVEGQGWGAVGIVVGGTLAGFTAGVLATGLLLLPATGAAPLLLAASVLLLLPLLFPEPAAPGARESVLHEVHTPFGSLRVTEVVYPGERQPERRMYFNGEEESGELVRSGAPTLAYIAAAERWLAETRSRGGSYLFLGGGAYTLPRRVSEADAAARITVVELDPAVTAAAYRFFGVRPEHRIQTVAGDARAFLESAEAAAYDSIYLDVYAGGEALPYSLVTRNAFESMARLLRPGGSVAINLIGIPHGPEAPRFWSVVRTLAEVFPSVALYSHLGADYPERQNFLLVASRAEGADFPPRAGLFERLPPEHWRHLRDTTVFRDLGATPRAAPASGLPPGPRAEERFREPRGERSTRS